MIEYIYAKSEPEKLLLEHMVDAGCVAIEILKSRNYYSLFKKLYDECEYNLKNEENFLNWIGFMIALHDIGKSDVKFQCNMPETVSDKFIKLLDYDYRDVFDNKFRHEIYGSKLIEDYFTELSYKKELACAIRMHHQKYKAKERHNPEIENYEGSDLYKKQKSWQKEIINELKNIFKIDNLTDIVEFKNRTVWWNDFIGLEILSDWVASSPKFIITDKKDYRKNAEITAKNILYKLEILTSSEIECKSFEDVFKIKNENMRGIQLACENNILYNSKLVIIEAATGEGKTEAALYTAMKMCKEQNKDGLYIALPTSATSNQMYERAKKVLPNANIKLVHSNAWLLDNNSQFISNVKDAAEWFSSTKRGLLCQNAVGTIDQAMQSVLKVKYSMLKLIGLQNKVIIIDEAHSYDSYMKNVIVLMLKWFKELDIPVIILSATLPDKIKEDYIKVYIDRKIELEKSYPLITAINNDIIQIKCKSFKQENISFVTKNILGNYEKYAKLILEKAKQKGYIMCVCNTVKAAQETYKEIKSLNIDNIPIYILHARFKNADRMKIEDNLDEIFSKKGLSKRPEACILITTQIVEQSLDYDFDYVFSEIAPLDLLIQRAGREMRFSETKRSETFTNKEMCIFISDKYDYGSIGYVYFEYILKKTQEFIINNPIINVPNQIREAINKVYDDMLDKENFILWSKMYSNSKLEQLYAESNTLPEPNPKHLIYVCGRDAVDTFCKTDADVSAKTRLSDESTKVVFAKDKKYFEEGYTNFDIAKKIHKQVITISLKDEIILTENIEGKGYLKGIIGICSDSILKTEKRLYEYSNEIGLEKK